MRYDTDILSEKVTYCFCLQSQILNCFSLSKKLLLIYGLLKSVVWARLDFFHYESLSIVLSPTLHLLQVCSLYPSTVFLVFLLYFIFLDEDLLITLFKIILNHHAVVYHIRDFFLSFVSSTGFIQISSWAYDKENCLLCLYSEHCAKILHRVFLNTSTHFAIFQEILLMFLISCLLCLYVTTH
jgi:hypothetical protein